MYTYTAYTLGIASEIPLPELVTAHCSIDITIRIVPASTLSTPSNRGDQFGGCVEGLASFEVLHGRDIHVDGYPVLTDDVMAVKINGDLPLVLPGFPQIKLWADSADSLGYASDLLPLLHEHTTKRVHQFSDGFTSQACPLTHLYVLAYGDDHAIKRLTPHECVIELVRHSRAVGLLNAPDYQIRHLQHCTQLVQGITIARLSRKPSLSALNELIALIKEDIKTSVISALV